MARKPMFPNQTTAVLVGTALFAAGVYCLYDAWEGRGKKAPLFVRPFMPI